MIMTRTMIKNYSDNYDDKWIRIMTIHQALDPVLPVHYLPIRPRPLASRGSLSTHLETMGPRNEIKLRFSQDRPLQVAHKSQKIGSAAIPDFEHFNSKIQKEWYPPVNQHNHAKSTFLSTRKYIYSINGDFFRPAMFLHWIYKSSKKKPPNKKKTPNGHRLCRRCGYSHSAV